MIILVSFIITPLCYIRPCSFRTIVVGWLSVVIILLEFCGAVSSFLRLLFIVLLPRLLLRIDLLFFILRNSSEFFFSPTALLTERLFVIESFCLRLGSWLLLHQSISQCHRSVAQRVGVDVFLQSLLGLYFGQSCILHTKPTADFPHVRLLPWCSCSVLPQLLLRLSRDRRDLVQYRREWADILVSVEYYRQVSLLDLLLIWV